MSRLKSLKATSLYYSGLTLFAGVLLGIVNYKFKIRTDLEDPGLLSIVPLVPAIFTFTPQFISKFPTRTQKRIDWLVKQPGINQFYYLIATQIIVLILLFLLNEIYSSDLLLSVIYGVLISYFLFNAITLIKFVKIFKN